MISINLKKFRNTLFAGTLGIISLSTVLIDSKPSLAISNNCQKPVPIPDSYPLAGVLSFGILGGGYLLKQRLKKTGDCFDENDLLPTSDNSTSLEFQIIDPTDII